MAFECKEVAMEQKMGYEKYKESFRKICVNSCVACGLALLTMVLAFVVPLFAYKEEVFGEKVTVDSFSLFDEAKWFFKFEGEGSFLVKASFILVVFVFIMNVFSWGYHLVKAAKGLSNIDAYACTEYDKIKTEKAKEKNTFLSQVKDMGISLVLLCVAVGLYMYLLKDDSKGKIGNYGYLALSNSVTSSISYVAIFLLLSWLVSLTVKTAQNKIKTEILLEAKGSDEKENEQKA